MKSCKLYVIIDRDTISRRDARAVTVQALQGGADIIQFRDKKACDRDFFLCARALRRAVKRYGRIFIINDRVDIARALNADGVHVGQEDMPLPDVRRIMGKKIIGISTHSIAEAKKAQKEGANYIGIGPIFKTATKRTGPPLGTAILNQMSKAVTIPFFAIGGISAANLGMAKASGCTRIAVASAVVRANNVKRRTASLKKALCEEGLRNKT